MQIALKDLRTFGEFIVFCYLPTGSAIHKSLAQRKTQIESKTFSPKKLSFTFREQEKLQHFVPLFVLAQ